MDGASSPTDASGQPGKYPDTSTDTALDASSNGDGATGDAGAEDAGSSLPLGVPLNVPPSTWTWVDFPDAVCDDGTPTGIGIWPSTASDKVAFFFAGGGACWDYTSCVTKSSSVHGPFGATEWTKMVSGNFAGWNINHADANNPFKDWTTIFVPYCTSDIHSGDNVVVYTDSADAGAPKTFHHKGRANLAAYLARIAATYPSPSQIAVTGSSAGGGGTLFNYPLIRSYWPNATSFLLDDSLPFLEKDGMPATMRQLWFKNWNLTPVTTPMCGADCEDDMSQIFAGLARLYPNDRMALLSCTTDYVIAGYYGIEPFINYWKPLKAFTTNVLVPTGHFKHFYVDGWCHTMLTAVKSHAGLQAWLTNMVSNDPTWDDVGPF